MLIPIREPVRLPTKLHPLYGHWSDSRYFLTFPSVNQYVSIPEVTLTGDFEIEFDCALSSSVDISLSGAHFLASSDNNFRVFVFQDTIQIGRLGYDVIKFNISGINFTSINSIRFTRDSSNTVRLFINDSERPVLTGTSVIAGNMNIDNIAQLWGQTTSVPRLDGVIANVRISDNGTPVRFYPLDDNSTTIRDTIGGNDGTYINGAAADWGRFERAYGGDWQGQGLTVPPWESVNQILEVA